MAKQKDNNSLRKQLLIALLLSLLFVHLPLLIFFSQMRDEVLPVQVTKQKQDVMYFNLKQPVPLVDITKPVKEVVPDKPTAFSKYNSKVKEEIVAAPGPRGQQGPKIISNPLGQNVKPDIQKSKSNVAQKQDKNLKPKITKKNDPKNSITNSQRMKIPNRKNSDSNQPKSIKDELLALKNLRKSTENKIVNQVNANYTPPKNNFQYGFGGGQGEYLPNYKVGSKTFLNTAANPHLNYYVELKRKFKFTWAPWRAVRGNRQLLVQKGKLQTVWGVSVDENGKVTDLVLIQGSGLKSYDYEAKRTLTASAPYSSPPSHLLSKDGKLHMAWTFIFYM